MAFPGHYHADSDADDEYERSVLTSPMPHTDDEGSSNGDSDTGSHDQTPTTFEGPDYDRNGARPTISDWSKEDCASFLASMSLDQYSPAFKENAINGEALIALKHEQLKEIGVTSVGHRLTILKNVYDMKIKQDVPIDSDHYVPLSAEEDIRNRQATQDDISRIIQSLQIRDQRILEAESELRRMHDEYKKLREDLLPLFKMSKERNESLPSPIAAGHQSAGLSGPPSSSFASSGLQSAGFTNTGLGRANSRNKNNLQIGSGALKHPNPNSPTYPGNGNDSVAHGSAAANTASALLQAQAQAFAGIDINTSPNMSSPGASPGVPSQQGMMNQSPYGALSSGGYSNASNSYLGGTSINDHRPSTSSYAPSVRTRAAATPSIRDPPADDGASVPAVEVFKSFRVSLEDPCRRVLPAALKKYNIQADWRQYALYIVYGDQERCLGLDEKPLILFKQLDKEGRKPMFMLRRHVAPAEGHTQSRAGDHMMGGDPNMGRNQSQIQLPGGVL